MHTVELRAKIKLAYEAYEAAFSKHAAFLSRGGAYRRGARRGGPDDLRAELAFQDWWRARYVLVRLQVRQDHPDLDRDGEAFAEKTFEELDALEKVERKRYAELPSDEDAKNEHPPPREALRRSTHA